MSISSKITNAVNYISDAFDEAKKNITTRTATYVVGAGLSLGVASCGEKDPAPKGGGEPGTDPKTEIRGVTIGANDKASSLMYNAETKTVTVGQSVTTGRSTITFKIVDKVIGPGKLDTLGLTSNGAILDPSRFDPNASFRGAGNITIIEFRDKNTDGDLKIGVKGYYIGDTQSDKTKKIVGADFRGVYNAGIEKSDKPTAQEAIADFAKELTDVKQGKKELLLVGQKALGYDGIYDSRNDTKSTQFVVGNLTAKP